MRRGPGWSQRRGGRHTHAAEAWVVSKRRRPPRPCGGGLGETKQSDFVKQRIRIITLPHKQMTHIRPSKS